MITAYLFNQWLTRELPHMHVRCRAMRVSGIGVEPVVADVIESMDELRFYGSLGSAPG